MKRGAAVIVAATLMMTGLVAPASAAKVTVRKIGKGVFLKSIQRRHPRLRIKVVTISRQARGRIRTVLGSGLLPGLERTSAIARRKGAVVAINGDYARPSGRPVMAFAQTGRLLQTPLTWGRNFAMTRDGSRAYVGHPHVQVELYGGPLGSFRIKRVNQGVPGRRALSLFTNHGGRIERPPRRGCNARLVPGGSPRRAATGWVRIRYRVGVVRCGGKRLRPGDGAILSSRRRGPKSKVIRSLRGAGEVSLTWSLGWEDAYQTVGGNPTLVEKGRIVVGRSKADPFFRRHPRTGVGIGKGGKVFFVTVDGRQKSSRGITLRGLARFFRRYLKARWALNLDGGGSTTMVTKGRVVNSPSDGPERPVSSALVVMRRGRVSRAAARAVVPAARVWDEMVKDPASTGGMADALVSRGRNLPRSMLNAARRFRRR